MPTDDTLVYTTAVAMRHMLKTKEISAEELLGVHLKRIDSCNASVNAIVTLVPDHARRLAREIDRKIHRGDAPGLLDGLPVVHKDLFNTQGIRTTYGSRLYEHHVPDENALIVQRIVDAGAVTLGKSNTPEWGAGSQTFNEVFGATVNPYDRDRTCGGSSGGAAVALASGMVPIADGSDMGGSLRNPANFCNIVGFRPSPGRVPAFPNENGWFTLPVPGPMARTVEDCALLLAAIAGPDSRVPISLDMPGQNFTDPLNRNFKSCKLAFSSDFEGQLPVAQAVQNIINASATLFEEIGCDVELACPDFTGSDFVFKTLRAWSFAATHEKNIVKSRHLYKDSIIWNIEQGQKLSGADIAQAERERTRLFRQTMAFLEHYDFLVLPVSQVPPFPVSAEYPTEIEGMPMETYIDWMKSCYFITCTGLPAISVPCGFTPEGLPVGVQIIGKYHDDLGVLQLAYAFQQANPVWKRHPEFNGGALD